MRFPGLYDRLGTYLSVFAVLIPIGFAVLTGVAFVEHLQTLAKDRSVLEYIRDVWPHLWPIIRSDGLTFAAFIVASITSVLTLWNKVQSNRRERLLRRGIGFGIWHGYERNFLLKVIDSFKRDTGGDLPNIILASPSLEVLGGLESGYTSEKALEDLNISLKKHNCELVSRYGEGKPGWFRQAFSIREIGASDDSSSYFFDIPTTLVAFNGALKEILSQKKAYRSDADKEKCFEQLKSDFFEAMRQWDARTQYGARIDVITLDKMNMDESAREIVSLVGGMASRG